VKPIRCIWCGKLALDGKLTPGGLCPEVHDLKRESQ
jgi:hypothetical protein